MIYRPNMYKGEVIDQTVILSYEEACFLKHVIDTNLMHGNLNPGMHLSITLPKERK